MPIMINNNVERVVPDANVDKMKARGYKVLEAQKAAAATMSQKAEEIHTQNVNIEPEASQQATTPTQEPQGTPEPPKADQDPTPEPEKADDGTTPPAAVADGKDQAAQSTDYESMNVEQLRKVAKELGVQGYSNMNRATLLAVIAAH